MLINVAYYMSTYLILTDIKYGISAYWLRVNVVNIDSNGGLYMTQNIIIIKLV